MQNPTARTRLVYINEGDVYTEPDNGPSYSFVTVLDASSRMVSLWSLLHNGTHTTKMCM